VHIERGVQSGPEAHDVRYVFGTGGGDQVRVVPAPAVPDNRNLASALLAGVAHGVDHSALVAAGAPAVERDPAEGGSGANLPQELRQ
jgi:hypothetical protein